MKKLVVIAAVAAGLSFSATISKAQVLINDSLNKNLVQQPGGAVGSTGQSDGTISSWVYTDSGLNGSDYIFIYQLTSAAPDVGFAIALGGFTTTDVSSVNVSSSAPFSLAGGGSTATAAVVYDGNAGGTLNFTGSLPNGAVSDYIIVDSNVSNDGPNIGDLQDSFQGNASILAPVPEASTVMAGALMLLPLGIGAVRAIRKERTT